MPFSNIWLSELVIIKLVSSAYSTGLDISDITLGTSLIYKRKSRGPSKNSATLLFDHTVCSRNCTSKNWINV